jgi:ABC-type Na+ efflux pump permease subunit
VSDDPAATDRGMWRIVAARDFSVRLRDKGFVISTAITVAVLSIFILLRAFASGPDSFDLAVVGDRTVADRAAAIGERAGIEVSVVPLPDERAADRALRAGDVDAVVIGDADDILAGTATLQVFRSAPSLLDQVVQAAAIAERIDDTLADAGVSDARSRPCRTSTLSMPCRSSRRIRTVTRRRRSPSRPCSSSTASSSAMGCGWLPA